MRTSGSGARAAPPDRFSAVLLALLLGYFFVLGPIRQVWKDHWLAKDGQGGIATITKEHWAGHGVVVYQYRVADKVYTGQDRKSRSNSHYDLVIPGEKAVVYFSSSHPWLSALDMPRYVGIDGLPVVLLVWFIEAGLVLTIVNPKNRWAFGSTGAAPPASEGGAGDVLRLVGCGVLVVLGMAVIEVGINAIFGR